MGTYLVEFKTAKGEALAISIPRTETAVLRYFQERMAYGLFVPDITELPSKDDCLAASASLAYAMLLPSGPVNTRCSVCRFDPGGRHVQLSPAPGNGFA
jgi:hypothetical protein